MNKFFTLLETILLASICTISVHTESISNDVLLNSEIIDCKPGESCDDGNVCTTDDTYDNWCNCKGTFQDEDKDGVCDAKDICPKGDDKVDKNNNKIPDACEKEPQNCAECEADENGKITICWIPTNKYNLKTIRGECAYLHKFFDTNGKLKGKSKCGPCECEMIGDKDTDGDGVCDGQDECPENPEISKNPGPCGCDDQDSDGDGVCDDDDICADGDDNVDTDGDGTPDDCDACPENPDLDKNDGTCGCEDQDSDGDGVCDNDDICPDGDDNEDADGDGTPDDCDTCPENPDLDKNDGTCGCEDQDSDGDGVCDNDDICPDGDDNEDADGDGTPDDCDACPENPNLSIDIGPCGCHDQDSDFDGVCDSEDCDSGNSDLPANEVISCDDGDENTINDVIAIGSCDCIGEPDVCSDSDEDGVCDDDDICYGFDDNIDTDGDGVPNGCDSCPDNSELAENTGPCGCDDQDTDGDGVCDNDDICPGSDDNIDTDSDGTPDGCDECPEDGERISEGECACEDCPSSCDDPCTPDNASSEYEWIEAISMNQLENESGDNGGYADFRDQSISLGLGDSLSLWLFPESVEEVCEHTIHIYADWNQDCDFDDEDELIIWVRSNTENGADIAIPLHAKVGTTTIRFMLHNGRLRNACQNNIDGEVEDYSLNIFSRDLQSKKELPKKIQHEIRKGSIEFAPNPINGQGVLKIGGQHKEFQQYSVRILNTDGAVVYDAKHHDTAKKINTTELASGIYFVEVTVGNEILKTKVAVQN